MFSVEIKVNGVLVGHLYCHNKGPASIDDLDLCSYYYEYYRPTRPVVTGEGIRHKRSHGIELLVRDIINDFMEQRYRPSDKFEDQFRREEL